MKYIITCAFFNDIDYIFYAGTNAGLDSLLYPEDVVSRYIHERYYNGENPKIFDQTIYVKINNAIEYKINCERSINIYKELITPKVLKSITYD